MCIQVHSDPRFFSRAAEFIQVDGAKVIPAGCSCRGCPSWAWCLSLIPSAVGSVESTSHISDKYPLSVLTNLHWAPSDGLGPSCFSLGLGAGQGGPWAGSHTLELTPTCPCRRNLVPNTLCCLRSLLVHQWWVGFHAPPGDWSLRICSRQEKMSGAAKLRPGCHQDIHREWGKEPPTKARV